MKQLRNILVPLELTKHSSQTLEYAYDVASKYDAKMHIVHVFEPAPGPWVVEQSKEDALDELEVLCKPYGIPKSNLHLCIGGVKYKILQLAELLNIDLIVIGYHSGKYLAPIISSIAETLISKAMCNVLTVVQNVEEDAQITADAT